MKLKYIILSLCFFSMLLLGKVPFEHLWSNVPVTGDSQVNQIYAYYKLISNARFEEAYPHLGSLVKKSILLDDFRRLYSKTNRPYALSPESVLSVDVQLGDKSNSDKGKVALKGKLVVGVKREFSGQAPLVNIEWSNSFIDLWVKENDRYVVYPDPFSFFRKEEFSLVYKGTGVGTLNGSNEKSKDSGNGD